jgi:hypothetical protein
MRIPVNMVQLHAFAALSRSKGKPWTCECPCRYSHVCVSYTVTVYITYTHSALSSDRWCGTLERVGRILKWLIVTDVSDIL